LLAAAHEEIPPLRVTKYQVRKCRRATLISICGYLWHSPWQSETVMSILWIRWTKVSHYRFAAEGVFLYFVSCGLSFILWNYLVPALNCSLFIGLLYWLLLGFSWICINNG
jgi:hypothetical protein